MASIYVSSLADYNAGHAHGVWIDLDGKDFEDVEAELQDMLKSSPTAFREGRKEEEWVIRTYEGFDGIRLSETDNLERVVAIAEALEEHGEAFAAFWENHHGHWDTVQDALEAFKEAYSGCYNSLGDFARERTESVHGVPSYLKNYIDWEAMGRDLERDGGIWSHEGSHGVHVFRND